MTNLLPSYARKIAKKEYLYRVGTVASVLFWVILGSLLVVFIAVYALVEFRISSVQNELVNATSHANTIENAVNEITVANNRAKYIAQNDVDRDLLSYIDEIDDLSGEGIEIEVISLDRNQEVRVEEIQLNAVADTRQTLIEFLDRVTAQPHFADVEVPLRDLSESTDINFSVRIPIVDEDQ